MLIPLIDELGNFTPKNDINQCRVKLEGNHLPCEYTLTRFGPNRVAADMEGNGKFDFG